MGCSDHATSSSLLDSLSGTPRSWAAALASPVPLSAALALPGGLPVWSGDSTPPVPLPLVTSTHPTVPLLTKSGSLPSPATRPWSSTPRKLHVHLPPHHLDLPRCLMRLLHHRCPRRLHVQVSTSSKCVA